MLLLNGTPDGFTIIYNLTSMFSYFVIFFRYFIIIMSVLWTIYAILNLWSVANAQGGQPSKFLPTKSQPTAAGAWIQLFIAGITLSLAVSLAPAAIFSSFLTGSSEYANIYTVKPYVAPTNQSTMQALFHNFIITVMQFMGLLAWFRGLSIWWNISQGTSDKTVGKVIGYFIFGTACFAIEWVNRLLANSIGFDFISILSGGGTG